eukprot:10221122-Lingulodinium_polyedra.AAC.1
MLKGAPVRMLPSHEDAARMPHAWSCSARPCASLATRVRTGDAMEVPTDAAGTSFPEGPWPARERSCSRPPP